ncbi:MAG: helix-turn-helix transcriptional regulator [Lachnospiraceae bacterium]|nr:helix-turn-helix transcriptional regulator [Lachnospiraceae bacterium]
MDQSKIGRFIAEKRKEQGMTQAQLAEQLGITDRAVSKWETGKSLPDASIMLELCGLLKITVNDLLSGEVVSMNNYNEVSEHILIEMVRQKEESDRRLLTMEVVIVIVSIVFFYSMLFIGLFADLPVWARALLITVGTVQFFICMAIGLRIEQVAGYYECGKCGHRYIPKYGSVFLAKHMGRTRFMKCPKCHKRSWQKKVLGQEKDAN